MAEEFLELTYEQRLEALCKTKMQQTREKQEVLLVMDQDDHGRILPSPEFREITEYMGPSGEMVRDAKLNNFKPKSNHPSGGFFGAKACGENFNLFLKAHPVYINPMSSLAGGYMAYFMGYRNPSWPPELASNLEDEQRKYGVYPGIGATQHFCQDMTIGFKLGWGGLLRKIRRYRKLNPEKSDFYDGLEQVVLGVQDWIRRHVEVAREMAKKEKNPTLRRNLEEIAEINEWLISKPPRTFREACQWTVWYQMIARMYNGSGSMGQIDVWLKPYYERESAAGTLTDEEAIFHLACLLLNDTQYYQLGGPDGEGKDTTNKVSFLVLEAVHRLKAPANIGIRVFDGLNPELLRRGVEIMFEDKTGFPKFLGDKGLVEGFVKNGYSVQLARQRVYSGCHWFAIPGREYTLNDCVKINFTKVFEVAFWDMMNDSEIKPSVDELWSRFKKHLHRAVEVTKEGLDFHMKNMHKVFPELVLDLLCYGTIEKGLDASNGGVEYYNLCIDGSGLATVADSFAAVEQRVEKEGLLTWQQLAEHLKNDFKDAENVRLMLSSVPRYGRGGTRADQWAIRIVQAFTKFVKEKPTPAGFNVIPGLFSWASMISMGQTVGATPNGRHAHAPISHGASPDPGFLRGGSAPTAMAVAVVSVQCGYGNAAPLQLDMDLGLARGEEGLAKVEALIKGHFELGGTMINMNVIDKKQILKAHQDPSKYPNLIVRVTGFSAYFASLSKNLRQLVVDRILEEET
ncbi:formate acetyltransferase [Candidatus Bathyarchaeota archaeon]|nr:formate acetyltransferase [Candidatus Bathyarchaeota archaeon]